MDTNKIDLNLLRVFAAVFRTRSATLAGEELDMTQSAVSNGLRRLRKHLTDPLFVKTPQGMMPTPLAVRLAVPLQQALDKVKATLESAETFDARTAKRAFTIYMSDVGQLVLAPKLVRVFEKEAPGCTLSVVNVPPRTAQTMMSEGGVDIAIGTFEAFQAGFHSQRLFSKTYVVIARRGHAALKGGLTLEKFMAARHAVYHPPAGSHDDFDAFVASIFLTNGVSRRVCAEFSHALGLVEAIAAGDMLMCVPRRLADLCAANAGVEAATLPFESPKIDVSQFWHHRLHADPGHRWLRSLVFKNYSELT